MSFGFRLLRCPSYLAIVRSRCYQRIVERRPMRNERRHDHTLRSLYQSVSKTTAVCPLNKGNCSGNRLFSMIGMTANAPPPLASQLTEIYCGFAFDTIRPYPLYSSACVPPLRGSYPRHFWISVCYRSIVPEQGVRPQSLLRYSAIAPSLLAGRRHALRQILA